MKLIHYAECYINYLDFDSMDEIKAFIRSNEKDFSTGWQSKRFDKKLEKFTSQFKGWNGLYSIWRGRPLAMAHCYTHGVEYYIPKGFKTETILNDDKYIPCDFGILKYSDITIVSSYQEINKALLTLFDK